MALKNVIKVTGKFIHRNFITNMAGNFTIAKFAKFRPRRL